MRVDPFAEAGELCELLLDRLLLFQTGLTRVEERDTDQHVSDSLNPLSESERTVPVKCGPNKCRRPGVAVKEHVLPRNLDVVKDQKCVDFVEAVRDRIVIDRFPSSKPS